VCLRNASSASERPPTINCCAVLIKSPPSHREKDKESFLQFAADRFSNLVTDVVEICHRASGTLELVICVFIRSLFPRRSDAQNCLNFQPQSITS
jgi:hypothetical protein